MSTAYVFGYGALVRDRPDGHLAELAGHRRCWGVAMDNRIDLPGYKWYRRADGSRPAIFVAFLDVVAAAGGSVNGVCTPVADDELARLDARERNYVRVDVTAHVAGARGRVWAYVGSAEGRDRRRAGEVTGRIAIARAYAQDVEAAFARLGPAELDGYRASTEAPPFPLLDLARVDLPG